MAIFLQLFYDITQSIFIPIYNRAIIIENIPIKFFSISQSVALSKPFIASLIEFFIYCLFCC